MSNYREAVTILPTSTIVHTILWDLLPGSAAKYLRGASYIAVITTANKLLYYIACSEHKYDVFTHVIKHFWSSRIVISMMYSSLYRCSEPIKRAAN